MTEPCDCDCCGEGGGGQGLPNARAAAAAIRQAGGASALLWHAGMRRECLLHCSNLTCTLPTLTRTLAFLSHSLPSRDNIHTSIAGAGRVHTRRPSSVGVSAYSAVRSHPTQVDKSAGCNSPTCAPLASLQRLTHSTPPCRIPRQHLIRPQTYARLVPAKIAAPWRRRAHQRRPASPPSVLRTSAIRRGEHTAPCIRKRITASSSVPKDM